jgi:hypothetical protein
MRCCARRRRLRSIVCCRRLRRRRRHHRWDLWKRSIRPLNELVLRPLRRPEVVLQEPLGVARVHLESLLLAGVVASHGVQI